MKTLRNCEENFKEPQKNSRGNVWKFSRRFEEIQEKVYEVAKKISRNLVKTLRNYEENFKKPRTNSGKNLREFWWKFEEI